MIPSRRTYKTYSHLMPLGRMPTPYELVTTDILYSAKQAAAVRTPVVSWYETHGAAAQFRCADWDAFRDPRATTYSTYTELQSGREKYVDELLRQFEDVIYERSLLPEWSARLAHFFSAARYPVHALQMSAAYVGQLAPSGRIAMAALFQCSDELRRVHRLAQRLALLARRFPEEANAGQALWQAHPDWQPLRRLLERQLVTYDWGEAFTSLCLCVKPELDALFAAFAEEAGRANDYLLQQLLRSLADDAVWHQAWAAELERMLVSADAANGEKITAWRRLWQPLARAATEPLLGNEKNGRNEGVNRRAAFAGGACS